MSMDDKLPAALMQPDSPFIPGTQVQYAWDSVSLTSILSCPRRYQYSIIEGRVSKNPNYAIALVFGILFHSGMEFYHKARFEGQPHDEAMHTALGQTMALPAAATLPTDGDIAEMEDTHDADEDDGIQLRNSKIRTRYYLARAIVWYLDHYGEDDQLRTLALPSGAPAVEVSFRIPLPLEVAGHPVLLCGHIDRIVEWNGRIYATDYKTTKSLTQQFFQSFDLSHQLTGYRAATDIILGEAEGNGVIIDGIALQVGQAKFGRHVAERTKGQIEEYFQTLRYATGLAQKFAAEGFYPMNTSACYFCEYKDICRKTPSVRSAYLQKAFDKKPGWNPLANR